MPVNATSIGPIDGVFTRSDSRELHLSVVAFVWNDASFNVLEGYWAYGEDLGREGLQFMPASELKSLSYHRS